ncbi:polysaccharide deacetylase family protein [Leminorella grimontii]|uniref:polysaccharide deacetylase family protein n=1 Tax=Leminorella grimontii TaxID=82981 RepID=UPI0020826597|nr:polysaccharide deacetylase family protein [Leminorella grimontii]GKX58520.1 hypothetical protein SOASR031_08350 [Leminorella grimontii]
MNFKHVLRLPIALFLFVVGSTLVCAQDTPLPDAKSPPIQVKLIRDSEVMAPVAGEVIKVGTLRENVELMAYPLNDDYYEFTFGNGNGLIDKDDLKPVQKSKKAMGLELADLQKLNQNLITTRTTSLYNHPTAKSRVFGELNENLRYPILGRLKGDDGVLWYEINVGDDVKYVRADDCELDNGIPVLTYHHVLRDEENKLFRNTSTTTSDTALDAQMGYLKSAGYKTLSMAQLEGYLNNSVNLPAKAVVLTFDDGLKSVYRYAYPILKKYDQHAVAFIISSRVKHNPQAWDASSLQFMSISELKQIQDVFEIQSHTHFLHRYSDDRRPVLLSRTEHNIQLDFERSARALRQFNPKVLYVSYPFGGYNDKAIEAARLAGYRLAVTTVRGKVKPGDNPFTLKRLYILRTDSIDTMAERIANNRSDVKPMEVKQ